MEILVEELLTFVFEWLIELSKNKNIPLFIRYPLILLIILFFLFVLFGIFLVGVFVFKTSVIGGIIIIGITIILFILLVKKFKKIYLNNK